MVSKQEENAALVEQFLTTVVIGSDTDTLDIFLTEDTGDQQSVGDRGLECGVAESTYWNALAAADIDIATGTVVASDKAVAVCGTVTGPYRELVPDRTPNGCSFEASIAWFCWIENGYIVSTWSVPDGQWLVRQLGAFAGGN